MSESGVASGVRVARVEVHPAAWQPDPLGEAVRAQAQGELEGLEAVRTARVYLIEAELSEEQLRRVAEELLADPVTQRAEVGVRPSGVEAAMVEVHYQPGVMDPVAQSTQEAIVEMFGELEREKVQVRTGWRYEFVFKEAKGARAQEERVLAWARGALANVVIQEIHPGPFWPEKFPHGRPYRLEVRRVAIRELSEEELAALSRGAHLFLSVQEMQAIQEYYRRLGREPTDIELETLAQTWSEHCVHKTLKSTVIYREEEDGQVVPRFCSPQVSAGRPGHRVEEDGTVRIENLLKSTVVAATEKLMQEPAFRDWCVSVFRDNAGVVRFDERFGVAIKVETHNHPSALEPYGGAATGIGGCIRDVMGTGLAAKPVANTDVFCVAPPEMSEVPEGVIHPRRILEQVVAGVRDYGNRMGIPTVSGAVYFHEDYVGNPLVYCGCVGLIPLEKCFGRVQAGDRIVVLGGRTGRDGIHGATFSSAELTDAHAEEFAHAVQIGNAITQKKMMDVVLKARDHPEGCLYHAVTDCGAGGFSSAVGEMGREVGAVVNLERAPLKYQGLSYTEIWISEAQERMVLAVPAEKIAKLQALCEAEEVEWCELGEFGCRDEMGRAELVLRYQGVEVGRLSMDFLHGGLPRVLREARWSVPRARTGGADVKTKRKRMDLQEALLRLLGHPNIASKKWIVRQYDHEVQGGSVIKPLTGPEQIGPSDAAVLRPVLDSERGVALACGLAPNLSEKTAGGDSYWAVLAAIDECVRNLVCVGVGPEPPEGGIAILDNFCWPSCQEPENLGTLVRAAEACYDGALAYRTPFVSGKDSLSNQFTMQDGRVITIPPTLLVTGLGIVADVRRCRTMDAKAVGNVLVMVGRTTEAMGGSHYRAVTGSRAGSGAIPKVDLKIGPATARAVAELIRRGLVQSAHDCSEGGMLVAAAEMAFAGGVGLEIDLVAVPGGDGLAWEVMCFAETPSRYLLEVRVEEVEEVGRELTGAGLVWGVIGRFEGHDRLVVVGESMARVVDVRLAELRRAWEQTLDW